MPNLRKRQAETHIPEDISQMVADGELDCDIIRVESEHSAMSACIGASATGVRTCTSSSSQGLALMHEVLFIAAGMRLPIVMTVANRALSAPISIWNDQQDSISERDSGWIQLYCENAQETFDTHIQAFKIAEEIGLPVMVCVDGFLVTHTYEPVEFLPEEKVKKFLPDYKPKLFLNPAKPVTQGALATPEHYMEFRKQLQDAVNGSLEIVRKVNREYHAVSGRLYGDGLLENVSMRGKKHALITFGSVAGTARPLLEKAGVGMIRLKCFRPFPGEDLLKALEGIESVGVLEKDISLGANGALYDEVRSILHSAGRKTAVSSFIAGLGGRDITLDMMEGVLKKIREGREVTEWLM